MHENQSGRSSSQADSISIWVTQAKNKTNGTDQKKALILKAYYVNSRRTDDSLKNRNLLDITFEILKLNDSILFRKLNREAFELSSSLKDTVGIAESYWNYGAFYGEKEIMDSAYYNYALAHKMYNLVGEDFFSGKMLYNMAFIQGRLKDYTGSEIVTYEAIKKFKPLENNLSLYKCYNHLGTVYVELEEYEKAVNSHDIALQFLNKIKFKKLYKEGSFNNIGLVYQKQGNHKMAIENFQKALINDSLKSQNIDLYARLIDNLAYSRFLNGETNKVLEQLIESHNIREDRNIKADIAMSKLHLAEFYAVHHDTTKAVLYAHEAKNIADKINSNRDKEASLILLAKLDKQNSNNYLKNYVALKNSLLLEERKIRNKFTRIRFETDEYREETERLSTQKILISAIGGTAVLVLLLLYLVRVQHSRNKELSYEREQQKSNEEIYSLMLKQQSVLEEGRLNERNRISEELHDGVLGKIFGVRLGLGFLKLKGDEQVLEKHKFYIDEIQQIEKEIRTVSHELKNEILSSKIDYIKIIESLMQTQSEIGQFHFAIKNDDRIYWDKIDDEIKINIYRIIQEAIQNINKHAKAKNVEVNFYLEKEMLKLSIKDDGVGFDLTGKVSGIGLKNMKSRALKLKAQILVDSNVKEGTSITIVIPLNKV